MRHETQFTVAVQRLVQTRRLLDKSKTRHNPVNSRQLLALLLNFAATIDADMAHILVINGPNLNLLGMREPAHYGRQTLASIQEGLEAQAEALAHQLRFHQYNAEHEIIGCIHDAYRDGVDFILINPAAYTHTSVAIRDALLATKIPFIEVHLSNVHAREPFRAHSYFSDIAQGVICGFGAIGYSLALQAAHQLLLERH